VGGAGRGGRAVTWLEDARRVSLAEVGSRLGLVAGGRGRLGPCPSCRAGDGVRHEDRRPPLRVYQGQDGGERWHCHRCQAGGDAVDLVAYVETGERFGGQLEVMRWFVGAAGAGAARVEARAKEPPRYPSPGSVRDLLRRCRPDGEAWVWCRARTGRDPAPGCLGTLTAPTGLPEWAGSQGVGWRATWYESGHRGIVPMVDHAGELRAVRARQVRPDVGGIKALPPTGYDHVGLWMASRAGRAALVEGLAGRLVLLVEGEPAWLGACSLWEPEGYVVLGFVAGSCQVETRTALAGAAAVLVAVDDDDAGRTYAGRWGAPVEGRAAPPVTVETRKDDPAAWPLLGLDVAGWPDEARDDLAERVAIMSECGEVESDAAHRCVRADWMTRNRSGSESRELTEEVTDGA
jgi:hypothetical protein